MKELLVISPIRLSKFVHMFLSLLDSHLEAEVTGGRVNRGGGYSLEVPCNYCLPGQEKAIEWVKNKITAITKFQSPLYGGQFQAKCSRGTGISVHFMECPLYRGVRVDFSRCRSF